MKDILEKILGKNVKDVVKLHGDASYRTYYRATLDDGSTFIIMQMPPGKSSVSEEITNFSGRHNELPFINVDHFLASCGLPVPKIFKYDEAEKIMVLEDLGDDLMANFVTKAQGAERERYYKKAIDLLVEMQRKTTPHPLPSPLPARQSNSGGRGEGECIALQRSFDATLLNWEFDHFREYLIEERGGVKMEDRDRELFETETRRISDLILQIPYCFTHRDFQSRNLIVRGDGSLAFIDFQDALMGPQVYDLVALLRDSYVELEWRMVEDLIKYYFRQIPPGPPFSKGGENGVQGGFLSSFHLVTIQRKMKDAGRFVYIDRVKKNPDFMQYIPTTLRYIKNAFERTGDAGELFKMLKRYVPELR